MIWNQQNFYQIVYVAAIVTLAKFCCLFFPKMTPGDKVVKGLLFLTVIIWRFKLSQNVQNNTPYGRFRRSRTKTFLRHFLGNVFLILLYGPPTWKIIARPWPWTFFKGEFFQEPFIRSGIWKSTVIFQFYVLSCGASDLYYFRLKPYMHLLHFIYKHLFFKFPRLLLSIYFIFIWLKYISLSFFSLR